VREVVEREIRKGEISVGSLLWENAAFDKRYPGIKLLGAIGS
jgi:hypothetical protein